MAIRYICEEIADCAKCDDTECNAIDIKTYQQVEWTLSGVLLTDANVRIVTKFLSMMWRFDEDD